MPEKLAVDLESLSDLCTPWSIHVVATLRIANHIAAGVNSINALATAAECDAHVLHCVMAHLVGKGVFEQPEPGRFLLNDASRQLLDPAVRLGLNLDGIGGRMAHAWSTLLTFTRTGTPAYSDVFGLPFWQDLDAHPTIAADFDALIGPAGHGMPKLAFDITGGWDSVRTIVDVGAGTGAMLAGILQIHPHLHGTLVDLPRTVGRSGPVFQLAGVSNRTTAVGQSFFDSLPAGADVYLLKGILNDWPDREARIILGRCAEAAGVNGLVVVLNGVVEDGSPWGLPIEMLLAGGKQRTVEELSALAGPSGLKLNRAGRQSAHFVVEFRRA